MPPPRPRNVGSNSGISIGRSNATAPMSERQQMALLMQMTSACIQDPVHSSRCLQVLKKNDLKKIDDQSGLSEYESNELYKDDDDFYDFKQSSKESMCMDVKSEARILTDFHHILTSNESDLVEAVSSVGGAHIGPENHSKKMHSDADSSDVDFDDMKRKKRKETDNSKEVLKCHGNVRLPSKQEKVFKQTVGGIGNKGLAVTSKANSSFEGKSPSLSPKQASSKCNEFEILTDDIRMTEQISGPKVPPLKIVIPQQSSAGDCESSLRNGKAILVRNQPALPYVVSSNGTDEGDKSNSRCNSPIESFLKNTTANVLIGDDKNSKSSNEDKNLRVLRSSHRPCGSNNDRTSNNSSPQLHSNSPSPASSSVEVADQSKSSSFVLGNTSSPQSHQAFEHDLVNSVPSPSTSTSSSKEQQQSNVVELHPRKRKIRGKQDDSNSKPLLNSSFVNLDLCANSIDVHPHDYPFTNCIQMYLNIRKQIERKHQMLFSIKPRPPQGFHNYLINRRSYILSDQNASKVIESPLNLPRKMRDIYITQENDRMDLKLRHVVEKEKLGLSVEQEILRVHAKAARSLTCQSLPFSASTILRDDEVYNMITPEQEEKDRNARSRFNGRLLLSWLQDVDDKWEKIKESMVLRHHNEAESLNAVQRMDWEVALKENELCDYKSQPIIEENHVPLVHVNEEFDLTHT